MPNFISTSNQRVDYWIKCWYCYSGNIMNYSELLDNVRNYTEVTSDVLSNSVINVFLTNIENQIDRLIDTDYQRRYATCF